MSFIFQRYIQINVKVERCIELWSFSDETNQNYDFNRTWETVESSGRDLLRCMVGSFSFGSLVTTLKKNGVCVNVQLKISQNIFFAIKFTKYHIK